MEHHFIHHKTFRYRVLNDVQHSTKILYVLHGYGQLVEHFIRKFSEVDEDYLIVAPEGMHRFYLNGTSGRVGASWMTKEAREIDISDTMNYLDALDDHLTKTVEVEKKYLLGFSQGGATAARWNQLGKTKFDGLILWASVFPPDLPPMAGKRSGNPHYFVIGDQDEFFSPVEQEQVISDYSSKNYKVKRYAGKHDIVNSTLTEILGELSRK